jgi:capsular exopolysaccharide synthesis family protein
MVTSALSGEGKTSLAGHLAVSLARAGRRTLLIDGDMRKPTLHRLVNLPSDVGLTDLLEGDDALGHAVRATQVSGLWLLPAGVQKGRGTQALSHDGRVRQMFERFRAEFDIVLLDTSPVLLVTDPLLLGEHADAVLLSLLRDVSRLPTVYLACQRLADMGIRVLGGVVNGIAGEFYGPPYEYGTPPKA